MDAVPSAEDGAGAGTVAEAAPALARHPGKKPGFLPVFKEGVVGRDSLAESFLGHQTDQESHEGQRKKEDS
jgi:hypothetical protein